MSDLKPCPFCGGTDLQSEDLGYNGLGVIQCKTCAAQGPVAQNPDGVAKAEATWNARADDRLREALEKAAQTAEQWGWCGYGKDICGPQIAAVIRAALAKEAGQ